MSFYATPLGINLWIAALVRADPRALAGGAADDGRRWMIPALLVFAAAVAWRDSPWLVALDLFALVVALALGALRTPRPVHRPGSPTTSSGSARRRGRGRQP